MTFVLDKIMPRLTKIFTSNCLIIYKFNDAPHSPFFEDTQARGFIGLETRSLRNDVRPLFPKIIGNCRNDNIVRNNNAEYLRDDR